MLFHLYVWTAETKRRRIDSQDAELLTGGKGYQKILTFLFRKCMFWYIYIYMYITT